MCLHTVGCVTDSVDPHQMPHILGCLIWVFTVCSGHSVTVVFCLSGHFIDLTLPLFINYRLQEVTETEETKGEKIRPVFQLGFEGYKTDL